jgi:hypothetical protein
MIAVIADDFTGAAEICGIGLRHGLNVILETEAIKHKMLICWWLLPIHARCALPMPKLLWQVLPLN